MAHYAIALDTHRCIGCFSCSVACKLENNLPDQVWYAEVKTVGGDSMHTPAGEYGANTLSYLVTQCNHCDNPACVAACPTGATYKDEATGIVMQNTEECIGCQSCIEACPYEGVRPTSTATPSRHSTSRLVRSRRRCTWPTRSKSARCATIAFPRVVFLRVWRAARLAPVSLATSTIPRARSRSFWPSANTRSCSPRRAPAPTCSTCRKRHV